ncbi:MAG: hypothetical protein CSA70_11230 [Rhodobacterales bacterium]|nr:MAG: hypothetical protein CSA70_11230 [Rhodobacterales bacterium]
MPSALQPQRKGALKGDVVMNTGGLLRGLMPPARNMTRPVEHLSRQHTDWLTVHETEFKRSTANH